MSEPIDELGDMALDFIISTERTVHALKDAGVALEWCLHFMAENNAPEGAVEAFKAAWEMFGNGS